MNTRAQGPVVVEPQGPRVGGMPEIAIDAASAIPLYHQLKEGIRRLIVQGAWREGDLLPTEKEWSERYGLSSTTIRRALGDLVHEQLLERKAGKGTFVRAAKVKRDLKKVLGFTENMGEMGLVPSTRVLDRHVVAAPAFAQEALGLAPHAKVLRLERLRMGDGIPMMLEVRYVRNDLCPGLIKRDLSSSLWKVFENVYGLKPHRHAQSLRITQASERASSLLSIPRNAAMFLVKGVTYLADGTPIECEESLYRSDRYEFSFEATA